MHLHADHRQQPSETERGPCASRQHLTLPSVMYLQFILRNFSVRASSSSEVDDTTLDWRRAGNTGGWTLSCLDGPSESWKWDGEGRKRGKGGNWKTSEQSVVQNQPNTLDGERCRTGIRLRGNMWCSSVVFLRSHSVPISNSSLQFYLSSLPSSTWPSDLEALIIPLVQLQ